jgi:outer membrane protein TolC
MHDERQLGNILIDPSRPLTYNDVIQLALCRNIDNMVRAEEDAIQREVATGEKLGMLPTLTGNYFLEGRSNTLASFSRAVGSGQTSLVQSTSTQNPARRWDFTLAWGILDFGMSYFKSRQEENKLEIIMQQHLRTRQNLLSDVTKLYWKAITAKKGAEDAAAMIKVIEARQRDIEKEIDALTISPLEGLDTERHLVEHKIRIVTYKEDLAAAKAELSGLIGLRIGCGYDLAPPPEYYYTPPNCMEELIRIALVSRPELMGQDFDERVQLDEVKIATLKMFPNAQLFSSYNRDQNLFDLHQYWFAAGIRASFDFLSLPKNYYGRLAACEKVRLSKYTRLSLSVGVLTQVYLAYLDYAASLEKYQIAHELANLNARLLHATGLAQARGQYHLDNLIKLQAETLEANMNSLLTYSELQVALERLGNAIGRPLAFSELATSYYPLADCPSLSLNTWTAHSFREDLFYHAIRPDITTLEADSHFMPLLPGS